MHDSRKTGKSTSNESMNELVLDNNIKEISKNIEKSTTL